MERVSFKHIISFNHKNTHLIYFYSHTYYSEYTFPQNCIKIKKMQRVKIEDYWPIELRDMVNFNYCIHQGGR